MSQFETKRFFCFVCSPTECEPLKESNEVIEALKTANQDGKLKCYFSLHLRDSMHIDNFMDNAVFNSSNSLIVLINFDYL